MIRYFGPALAAQLSRARSLYALSVLGVALGVASVVSIQVLNHNALAAFSGGVRAVSGDADLSVLGVTETFSDSLFPRVLADPDVVRAWPLYRFGVALADEPEVFLDVVGTDLLGAAPLPLERAPVDPEGHGAGRRPLAEHAATDPFGIVSEAVSVPGWAALTPAFSAERGLSLGDTLAVSSGSQRATLRVGALVDFQRYAPLASRHLAVMDISQVQAFLGRSGRLHQIDVQLADRADVGTARTRLAASLGSSVRVATPGERIDDAAGLLAAFRLNLTALSLISLFVGTFLIFSSTQASLVRRRSEFGVLRSLGATRRQTLAIVLAEVALLGTLGVALGLPLGYWAAERNVHHVSATLTNIYLLSAIERLEVPVSIYVLATLVGLGGALLGAALPGWDAVRRDPHGLLVAYQVHESTARRSGRMALLGLALLLASWAAHLAVGSTSRYSGFGLGLALLVGLPLLTPWTLERICRHVPVRGFDLTLALRNLATRLQTTSFAVASLAIAVSMMVGITLLVASFRATLATWVESSIRADIYVTTESWVQGGSEAYLSFDVLDALRSHPAVRGAEELRRVTTRSGDRPLVVAGISLSLPDSSYSFPLREGDLATALHALRHEGGGLISEPLSRKTGLGRGDRLPVSTEAGPVEIPIAGVSYDYTSEGGGLLVSRATLERHFGAGPAQNVALFLHEGSDADVVIGELRSHLAGTPLLLRSNRAIREEIFRIFDQTFAITRLLQGMALLVAACGISLTLLVLARERVAELALYRSLGAARRQIFLLFVREGASLAGLGLALGTCGGLLLAAILIHVINPAFFGWTIRPAWSWGAWAEQSVAIVATAIAASLYPALRASRVPAQELSREDL